MMVKRSYLFTQTENRCAGYTVYDYAGEKIGKVDEVFVNENGDTEHVAAKLGSLEPRYMLIPIDAARVEEQLLKASVSRERVKDTLDSETPLNSIGLCEASSACA